ncbi:MAG: transketolase [Enterobacterales bacterium]
MISRKILANAIRVLSMDSVQRAQSGHPGAPMGMADVAEVLWRDFINHNPCNPNWCNRDRFVLSNGHASMLLYSILHLTGYNITIDDLKNFRQLHSKTPGHPERGCTDGVEVTTGPLGQGFANAVGLAIAERTLSAQFNFSKYNIIDHYTYVFLGDGCMMEGISHEAGSLAGVMKLGKLIAFYDDNGISIDGKVINWFADDTAKRFESYNWHVIKNINGHDSNAIKLAIEEARNTIDKPSLIICKTIIAYGSPNKSGNNNSHGAPLGEKEIKYTKEYLNWEYKPFLISKNIYKNWNAKKIGLNKELMWIKKFNNYKKHYPNLAKEFIRRINNKIPLHLEIETEKFINQVKNKNLHISGRQSSQNAIEFFGTRLPEFLGGSADLTSSNLTAWTGSKSLNNYVNGNYIHYGVREFCMIAIGNGISCHGGFIPYTSTFLTFSDYAKNAIRMAALMNINHIMIYTHDSIGVGEDGPTHQPIEQLSNLRSIPNLHTWRPCDQIETIVAWKHAIIRKNGPTALILSRQNLEQQNRDSNQINNISKGGYILKNCISVPQLILISSGSEICISVLAYNNLTKLGYKIRVVSMPSTNVFDEQNSEYKEMVLPKNVINRIAIEASFSEFWYKYVGLNGIIIGMNSFGKSAPSTKLFEYYGLTVENIIKKSLKLLS